MYNKKVLREATKNLNSTKAPAKKKDMIVDPMGQWKHPGENTRIPGNDITMQGVPYPVWAVPNVGIPQMMYPEQDYYFPGADHVDEYPQMKTGGVLNKAQTGKIIKCPEGYTYDQKTKKCVSNYERSEYAYPEGTQIRDIHEIHDIWPSNLGRDFVHINEPIYVKPIEQKELVYTKGQHPQTINIYPDINYKLSVDPSKPEGYDKNTNTYYVPSENTHQYRKYKEWEKAKELEKQNLQIADELIKTGQFNYEVNPDQTKSLIKKAGNYTDPNYLPEGLKSYDETYKQTAKDRYNQYLKTNCPECSFGHGESVYYDNDYVYRKENPTLGGYESIDKKIKPILKRTRESIDPTIEDSKKPEINYRYGVWGATGATPQGGGKTEATSLPEGTWNNSQQNYKRKNTLNTLDLGNTSFAQGGLVLHDSLRTWDLGDYEGLPETTETKKLIKKHENNPDLPIPGGETYNEFKQRITPGFEKLLKDAPDKSLIVTHSHVIKTLGLPKTKHGEYHTIKKHGKTIYIAPHGDTPQNKSVKETPDQIRTKDVDLAPKGVNEVENLSKKLANKNISAIYASPLPRTIETATIIKNSLGNKFQVGGDISIPDLNQYEDGGEYDLTQEEIDDLIAQGYIVEDADEYKKGGTPRALPKKKSSKGYSRSLTATNKLFAESPLTKKSKSKKNKIFDPNAKYYQDGGPYSKTINTFTNPVVNETDENTGYNAATGEINQDTRPGSIENNNWWTEHEKFHHLQNLAGGMSSAGILGQRPNNTVASDQAMGNYYNRRDNELEAQTNAMIKADPNLQFIPRNKLAEGAGPGFIGANDLMYSDPSTLEGEARNYENYIRQGGKSIFPQKQEGGAQLPKDYSQFTNFHQTLPSNLQDPEYQYGNPDQYDLYGMWNTLGKPGSFKDVQDSDYFPLQDDGTYHGFSVGSDGTVLKPMSHSTTWKEVMNSQLNTDPYFKENRLIKNEQGRLQYVPNKQEGGISPLEGNYISKVIMNRNRGTDFVDRAYALGDNPGTPMFNLPDNEQFGQNMSHKMAWGDDDNGQAWMYPTIMNPNDEAIQVPTQYANYISSEGYKYATGMKQKGGAQDRFNTKLKGNVLESFNEHAKQFPSLLNDTYDYDSRGLYNELYDIHKGDKEAIANALTPGSPTAHVGTDRYKKPNHPTFSKESKYYIPVIRNAGTWGHNDQGDYFKASRRNIRNMTNSDGSPYQYFQRAEDYDLDSIPDVGLEYRGKKLFEKGGFQDDLGKHRQLLRDWTYGQSIGMLQKAQEGLDTGVVESKTPWANAPEGMSPNVYEGKDITVKAKGPEWAHFQREYQNANPWERYLAGEKNKYIRKHKGLNKTAGVTADNFPKDAEERIRQEYDRKMNTYTTRRLGQHFGFNPRQRGEWIDRLTDKQKEIVAGSKYGSKLQPNVWSRFLSGARSTVNLLHPTEFKIQGQIPGYTEAENKEALNSWLEPLEILAPLDAPGMIVANKMTNMNAENPSWYSGEMMGNVDYGAVVAMNPLTLLDLYGLPEAPLRISRGLKKVIKAVGKEIVNAVPEYKNVYRVEPTSFAKDPTDQLSGRWFGSLEEMPFYVKNLKDPNAGVRIMRTKLPVKKWEKISGLNMPEQAKFMSAGTGKYNTFMDAVNAGELSAGAAKRLSKGIQLPSDLNELISNPNLINLTEGIVPENLVSKIRTQKPSKFSRSQKVEFPAGSLGTEGAHHYIYNIQNEVEKPILGLPRKYVPFEEGGETDYEDLDLTPEEIDWYLANGYDLEDLGDSETFDDYLPEAQTGFVIEGKTNAVPQKKKTAAPIPPPVVTEDIVVSKTPTEKLVIQGKTNAVPKTETRKRVQPPVENAEGYFAKSPYAYQSLSGYMAKNPIVPEQVGLTPYAADLIEGKPHTTISGIQKPAKKSKPLTAKEQSALEAQIKYKLYGSDDDSEVYGSDLFPGMDELIDTKTQQLKRFLEKKGVVDTKDYKLDPKKTQSKKAPVVAATPKAAKFYQELGTVPDSYDPKHNLLSYRNQWDNKEGFEYIATPVKKDRSGNEEYKNVKGVGHFLLDASVANGKVYKWKDNDAYINQAKKNNEWIPAFTRVNGDRVKLQYKKADELTKKDIVVSPLRQMSYDEIKFDQTQRPEGFQSGIKEVKKSDGQGTYLLFKDRNGYSRFSGGSVVFIFKDKYGNTIVRDYAGSLNGIENEGINIKKEYNLKPGQLTIGYHDVGSFSAKPKADSTGTLRSSQWEGFNNNGVTGGALLIPNK